MTDLADALAQPGVADAFESVVSLMIQATTERDPDLMRRAGYQFGHLHDLCGGRPEDRDVLMGLVREAAVGKVVHIFEPH